tara:strand:- start:1333 stop:4650 length:3318 start_codon:yes stop_codon:yes gene_type:complete
MFSYLLLLSQDNTFIRTYNLDGMNGGLALAVMNDGGFVGTGQHSDNGACRVYAYRIDECGNIIWFNLYNSGGGVAIDETFDNGVVIACDGGRILKIDSIGNPEWEKYYSSVGGYMTAIIQTSDSGYFAGGQSGQLLKLDNYGEVVWSASISGYNVHALDEFPNGDLMYFAWDNNSFFVGRVSPLGNLIWQNQYSSGSSGGDSHNDWAGEALIDKNLNRIIIASNSSHNSGDVLITSLDYNGGIIASNAFGSVSSSEFVRSIDLTDDGGYVIGGGTYGYNTTSTSLLTQVPGLNPENLSGRDILLFKVDPSLNFEWSSVIGCGGSEKAIGVRSNQDNGYSISAYTDGAFFSANYVDPLFIKTDSMGRVGCQQYSPVLTQTSISTSINTTNTLTFNSSVATTNSIVFNSISPTDYYMCLDCSTTPFFTISDTSLCVGDTTWFVNNSSGLICNQNWFVDGVLISGPADSVPFVFSSPGLHNIKLETSCGATYVDYEIDFYVNNLKLYVTNISDYNSYQISCYGYDDGFIETYATSPFPPVNYNWSTLNPSSSDQFNMYAGSYDLQLTDEFGCVFDTTFLLIEPTPLISSYAVSFMNGYNVTCNGGQDGYIDLTVNGSVPLYNYLWNNGNTTGNLNNLGAGEYYVTITDQNGCIATDTIEINEPILNIQENVTNVNCYGASNGSALVNVSGNTSPYYIFWGNNLNTSFLSAGIYSYQIVDSIGCIYNDSLIVSEPDSFVVVENITNVSCYGGSDGEISLNISGATPPYVVDWLGFSTTNMSAGTYNFTILDFNNCPYSEIAIVSEPNPIDVLNLVIDPTCNNTSDGSVSLQINGGTSPYLIDWGLNNPDSLAIGSYEFLVTDNNNCVDTNIVSLVSESNIVVNTNVSSVSCKGFCDGSVDLIIDGGVPPYAVNWFGLNAAFLCEGSVIFEVSDDLNCYYNQTIAISAPDSVDLQINQVGMFLEALASGGISPYSYQWFDGAGPISSNQTVSLANYGFYNCIVIDQNNCQSDTVSFNYTHLSVSEGVDNNIYIYPNPAENEFVIEFNTDSEIALEINLINVLGQYILLDMDDSFVGEYKHSIDISSMSKGVYFVSLKLDDKMINRKVIIK